MSPPLFFVSRGAYSSRTLSYGAHFAETIVGLCWVKAVVHSVMLTEPVGVVDHVRGVLAGFRPSGGVGIVAGHGAPGACHCLCVVARGVFVVCSLEMVVRDKSGPMRRLVMAINGLTILLLTA